MSLKRIGIIASIAVSALLALSFSNITGAQQVALTNDEIALIKRNCQSSKVTLERLHASDALLRVNRGQVYEALATRLMDNFNTRLSGNGLDNRAMTTITNSYKSALNDFRSDYKSYEEKLSQAIKIDCDKKPSEYHYALEDARVARKKIHQQVTKLHRFVDDYRTSIDDFMINFDRKAK